MGFMFKRLHDVALQLPFFAVRIAVAKATSTGTPSRAEASARNGEEVTQIVTDGVSTHLNMTKAKCIRVIYEGFPFTTTVRQLSRPSRPVLESFTFLHTCRWR